MQQGNNEMRPELASVRDDLMTAAFTHDDEAPPWGDWDDRDELRDWLEHHADAVNSAIGILSANEPTHPMPVAKNTRE